MELDAHVPRVAGQLEDLHAFGARVLADEGEAVRGQGRDVGRVDFVAVAVAFGDYWGVWGRGGGGGGVSGWGAVGKVVGVFSGSGEGGVGVESAEFTPFAVGLEMRGPETKTHRSA